MDEIRRLWRLRRLHHYVDAQISAAGDLCELRFLYDGEVAYVAHRTLAAAAQEAAEKRAELERAGWSPHW